MTVSVGEMPEPLSTPGLFLDTSEFRRLNFNFSDRRLIAVQDLAASGRICLLSTDVTHSEITGLIAREVGTALEILRGGKTAVLKSIDDNRLDLIRALPDAAELSEKLFQQFESYFSSASGSLLSIAEVDPSKVFDDYFNSRPPFDHVNKKVEFPDAFALRRLLQWAAENTRIVYVVGPDPDLKRFCDSTSQLEYFDKAEAVVNRINREDEIVQAMHKHSDIIKEEIEGFAETGFAYLGFILKFNDHGSVESVSVDSVEVTDIYGLEIIDSSVKAEAVATVCFTADFEYDDYDTASYDRESDTWFFLDTVSGEAQDCASVGVGFNFAMDERGKAILSELTFLEDTIAVREEDRGDYDAYK